MGPDNTHYRRHIERRQRTCEALLARLGYDGLLIFSGTPRRRFQDDQTSPFVANPHFKAWLPLPRHSDCALLIRPGRVPRLFYFNPVDFWHLPAGRPQGFWCEHFDIIEIADRGAIKAQLPVGLSLAFLGEEAAFAAELGIEAINPDPLLQALNWERAVKSEYEIGCLREANYLAVVGHRAAEAAFRQGASEFAIHQAYLTATGVRESELPYPSIVALNDHGAVLHYQHLDRQAPHDFRAFLLDAGVEVRGYAADITRTHVYTHAHAHARGEGLFAELIEALDEAQQHLLGEIRPGVDFVDLHLAMHRRIAGLLRDFDLVTLSVEGQLETGISRCFFPHGLGHLLGLQVHDVGGLQADARGTPAPPPAEHPFLRLTRTLKTDMVLTVEPGLYFIEPLLNELKAGPWAREVNWSRVEVLQSFGGIRVEDNIRVTGEGIENLTRDAFAQTAQPQAGM